MDRLALPDTFMNAGEGYLAALENLGLRPEGLLWAFDATIDNFVLVLVTAQFDHVGPTAIYKVLTRAYRASITPEEINPFVVRLHSVNHAIVPVLKQALDLGLDAQSMRSDGTMGPAEFIQIHLDAMDLKFKKEWVYRFAVNRIKPAERSRRWKRFSENVERLAA